ncbi:MAG: serine/threonine-protein kinase [Gammaproteobacteria bacterium]|nr:serine/threonine-protein kinase [Gammaproteobacteria bacterium]
MPCNWASKSPSYFLPVPYLVLKLVEGQTLAERLEKGPLPVEETLDACQQIAEALQPAHVQGIIHRDLKPDNVKITPDGQVKVLDFGLAKAIVENLSTDATTLTGNVTMPGTLLGTAPYMSPEQAKGNPVDKRSDIWSFGCVLYECLTGQRAFKGDSTSEIIGAVMHAEPNWSLLPPNTPLALHRVLRRCLVRDARNRLHDVADAQLEIAEVLAGSSDETLAFSIASGSRRWLSWGRVVALCVVSMLLGSLITALNRQNVHREDLFERGKVTSHQRKVHSVRLAAGTSLYLGQGIPSPSHPMENASFLRRWIRTELVGFTSG